MTSWSGSIEIGVTECDPEIMELPACATNLRQGTWIMSDSGIMHDGIRTVEMYGMDLNELEEGSTLGVMRTSNVSFLLFICKFYIYILIVFVNILLININKGIFFTKDKFIKIILENE